MADHPAPAGHRDLTKREAEALSKAAFRLEVGIKKSFARIHESWWTLSRQLYEFHEGGYWSVLGYDTLEEFLAQPDLGMSRRSFFQMTKLWRDLVVTRQIEPDTLADIEPSKVALVTPALMKGDVSVEDALGDARDLGWRDVREKYSGREKPDQALDAEAEPIRVQCPECGSYYIPKGELDG